MLTSTGTFTATSAPQVSSSIIGDYDRCLDDGFGRSELICDPGNLLSNTTKAHLRSLLSVLEQKVQCDCDIGCQRPDGNDKYLGLLIATTLRDVQATGVDLETVAQYIFENTNLTNEGCDNGILIIYVKDKRQLATYRGFGKFILWNSTEVAKLHHLATKTNFDGQEDIHVMPDDEYRYPIAQADIQRAEVWPPILGLLLALILVLLILGLLLALLLAKYCCLCARRHKKDKYCITGAPIYKTFEPLFVTTPTLHERILASQSDAIYSTPYSGTPVPPPHFAPSRIDLYPGSARSANASQCVTPLSTHKNRIHPLHGYFPRGLTPPETPAVTLKVDDSTQTNDLSIVESSRHSSRKNKDKVVRTDSAVLASHLECAPVRTTSNVGDHDLSFLDPRRPLEVQTRTDYIY
uniref:TPM domain-containing protein n=1 Tax=Syphacia muris TaxID=451379 RepID=A0A0N5AYU7_9BILA